MATYRKLKMQMQAQSIIPDLISTQPGSELNVVYEGGIKVERGNFLTPTQVKNKPVVTWDGDIMKYYLLCMVDLDAPSREKPIMREWLHWMLGDVPGGESNRGTVLADYIGIAPPQGTGFHRYVFLVYKQPQRIRYTEDRLDSRKADHRPSFSIKEFTSKYKCGEPIAGNFFQAEWDEYVPILQEELSCCGKVALKYLEETPEDETTEETETIQETLK